MLSLKELEDMRSMFGKAKDGLADAQSSAAKLAAIGVTMDISKLEAEVARLEEQLAAAEQVYADQNKPAPEPIKFGANEKINNPYYDDDENLDLITRVERLEVLVASLMGRKK